MHWQKLCTASDQVEADLIAGLLDGEGIPVKFARSGINNYLKVVMGPVVAVDILVPAEQITEAATILEAFQREAAD